MRQQSKEAQQEINELLQEVGAATEVQEAQRDAARGEMQQEIDAHVSQETSN